MSNSNSSIKIWEITDKINVKEVNTNLQGNVSSFILSTNTLREFIAFDGTSYLMPENLGKVENQDLHGLGFYDLLIITHKDFISEANRLADIHRKDDSMSVLVVTPALIYNEFSSGIVDITAIRDFVKMFYDRAATQEEMPDYLLLFGDGSYDPKNRIISNTNFIPAFQSLESLHPVSSFVTDDYFGLLDINEGENAYGVLDIGVGRLPVNTIDEARNIIEKIIKYTSKRDLTEDIIGDNTVLKPISNFADWRNVICFIADDDDVFNDVITHSHRMDAEYVANFIDSTYNNYNIDKIYLDAYIQESTTGGQRYPEANRAINDRMKKGALVINYTGHGGEVGWTHERVLEISDINKWDNKFNMPFFLTGTCEFTRFDDPERVSAGELVLHNPNGGGIGLFTTTRATFPNMELNRLFYVNALNNNGSSKPRLGDVIRETKSTISARKYLLLADPAVSLAYPQHQIITTQINNKPVGVSIDTLKAFAKITISGIIQDKNGNKLTWFNGKVYPTVYDKPSAITTQANDGGNTMTFNLQNNILYKGKATVKNGEFSFTFIVPKDIAYIYGPGRISYYAENGNVDGHGYFEEIIIGGSDDNVDTDITGPEVEIFLKDETFVFGGMTDENPLMIVYVSDSNGINTIGSGIGHDIVAVLDNFTDKPVILNSFYESDLDSYTNGTIRYQFTDLSPGFHKLKLKVWDGYNNSTDAYTEFVVAESAKMALLHVFNYPNPFTTHTRFFFDHNQPETEMQVMIQIFTISGRLIKTINSNVLTNGYRSEPINWDGRDDFGDRIGKGVYIYRLRVQTENGSSSEKIEKLVILR